MIRKTPTQDKILLWARTRPSFNIADLTRELGIERKAASQCLQRMQKAGLIRKLGTYTKLIRWKLRAEAMRPLQQQKVSQINTYPDWPARTLLERYWKLSATLVESAGD